MLGYIIGLWQINGLRATRRVSRFHTFIGAKQQVIGSLLISSVQSIFDLSFVLICLFSWMKLDFLCFEIDIFGVIKKKTPQN
jgi:hypothetical protein